MLALIIAQAKQEGQVEGVIPHLVDDGLSILQYADDTIIFMCHDMEKSKKHEVSTLCFRTTIWS